MDCLYLKVRRENAFWPKNDFVPFGNLWKNHNLQYVVQFVSQGLIFASQGASQGSIFGTKSKVSITSWPRSWTRDNCRMPLSGTQFPRLSPMDPQSIIVNHCPFENLTKVQVNEYIIYNFLKIENPIEISAEFCLKNGLRPFV